MARSVKLRCCVFNKFFLVNHRRDIPDCSCKWLCYGEFCFALRQVQNSGLSPLVDVSFTNLE